MNFPFHSSYFDFPYFRIIYYLFIMIFVHCLKLFCYRYSHSDRKRADTRNVFSSDYVPKTHHAVQ